MVPENFCFFLLNQKAERRRPFGTGLVRHCPQGLFSPFFTFLRAIFFRPFRLSLAPTIYPWVSEDALDLEKFRVRLQKRSERSHHMKVEDLTLLEQTTQLTHMPSYRGKYTKSQHFSPTFLPSITHALYRACTSCLACQHFDLNNADWFSDSQHVSSR